MRISLGELANTTSAHLCNLESLAIVNDHDHDDNQANEDASCATTIHPLVTHRAVSNTLLPRAIFVDQKQEMYTYHRRRNFRRSAVNERFSGVDAPVLWDGKVEMYDQVERNGEMVQDDASVAFQWYQEQAGLSMACALRGNGFCNNYPGESVRDTQFSGGASSGKDSEDESRYVNWDDENFMLGNDYEEMRQQRQHEEYENERARECLEQSASQAWSSVSAPPQHWYDYITFPFESSHADLVDDMMLGLPNVFPQSHDLTSNGFLYGWKFEEQSSEGRKFREDILSESLRRSLEESDGIAGFQILIDFSSGFYAGMATSVLEELRDECRSAGRWSIGIHFNNEQFDNLLSPRHDMYSGVSQHQRMGRFRRDLNLPMGCYGVLDNSEVFLPLDLVECMKFLPNANEPEKLSSSIYQKFFGGAVSAILLEASSLSYRSHPSDLNRIATAGRGMNYSVQNYVQNSYLGYGEFLSMIAPSPQLKLLQINGSLKFDSKNLYSQISDGSSLSYERLQRSNSQNRHRFSKSNLGKWLDSPEMQCASPFGSSNLIERNLHSHFSLSSYIRCASNTTYTENPISDHLETSMESFLPCRPDRYSSCVVGRTLGRITYGGNYWSNEILSPIHHHNSVVALLENSTRSYSFAKLQAQRMSRCLSRGMKGFFARDATEGLVPDYDECNDALEFLRNLEADYDPGVDDQNDDPNEYYDGNED